jgi:hypothetical protein
MSFTAPTGIRLSGMLPVQFKLLNGIDPARTAEAKRRRR